MRLATNRLFLLLLLAAAASPIPVLAQDQDRLLNWTSHRGMKSIISLNGRATSTDLEAIEIIEFKVAGVTVTPGQPFPAGEDWLKDLSVRVKNVSGKALAYLSVSFTLPAATYVENGREYQMGYTVEYQGGGGDKEAVAEAKAIMPGEEVELTAFAQLYSQRMQEIEKKTGVQSVKQIEGGWVKAVFSEGGTYNSGTIRVRAGNGEAR